MLTKTMPTKAQKKPSKVTLGSDPEFMLWDNKQRKIVSAIPVLKGDKHSPVDLGDGIEAYADNVLCEVRFPPVDSKSEFISRLRDVFKRLQKHLGERYQILPQASHMFDEVELGPKPKVMIGELPVEWEIGCNPSFDAYAQTARVPKPFEDGLRTGSFHIHIGNEKLADSYDARLLAIKLLDVFVGCPSIIFDRDPSAPIRRKLYGKAGEYRSTPYGLEWRVLSNFPLRSPKATELVYDLVSHVTEIVEHDLEETVLSWTDPNEVKQAINNSDRSLAELVLSKAKLPHNLLVRCHQNYDAEFNKAWGIS